MGSVQARVTMVPPWSFLCNDGGAGLRPMQFWGPEDGPSELSIKSHAVIECVFLSHSPASSCLIRQRQLQLGGTNGELHARCLNKDDIKTMQSATETFHCSGNRSNTNQAYRHPPTYTCTTTTAAAPASLRGNVNFTRLCWR